MLLEDAKIAIQKLCPEPGSLRKFHGGGVYVVVAPAIFAAPMDESLPNWADYTPAVSYAVKLDRPLHWVMPLAEFLERTRPATPEDIHTDPDEE